MWDQISVNTVDLLYLAIGGFLCLFMLFSAVIKDRFYLGEANVALLVGAILGPFAATAVDPNIWPHFDTVVLEFSRVVIIIQCFAVALELPKYYIHHHWKSLLWLVGPVVVWGWMVCTLLVWFMVPRLSFTQSMTIASCFNAIDPVMAATIVGNGRFAKTVPRHIRDLLLAESASNDVTTSVCLGLSILLTRFPGTASEMARSLFIYTKLYQIFLAGVIGLIIGWAAGKALKYQEEHESTDRESFLAFFLMLALFCIGLGSLLGIDDVLMAFCAGYNFDKTKWWRRKTEESHVSDAINLLLNLTYFVFLGSMIPWSSFNKPDLQISAWRLVTGTLLIFILRRIPIILLLKPAIPDINTWREALFFGHFGPVGVGAIFSAALISSEPGKTGIVGNLLKTTPGDPMQLSLWPIVTFVVLCSSIVHGSSIPLFHVGKHINTLTLVIPYSAGQEDGPAWLNRLPRITSVSASQAKDFSDEGDYPPGSLPPIDLPRAFLRRQREEDSESNLSRSSDIIPRQRRRSRLATGIDLGGPVSRSVIYPVHTSQENILREIQLLDSEARAEVSDPQAEGSKQAESRGIRDISSPQNEACPTVSSRDYPETVVERRRRLAALAISGPSDSSGDDSEALSKTSAREIGRLIISFADGEGGTSKTMTGDENVHAISELSSAKPTKARKSVDSISSPSAKASNMNAINVRSKEPI